MTALKVLVVCLALANVAYFLWEQGIAQSVPGAASASLKLAEAQPAAHAVAAGVAGASEAATVAGLNPADGAGEAGSGMLSTSGGKRCITIGPFRDVSEAAHAATLLRTGGYDPRQRVVDGELAAGVWVYLPVPASPTTTEQLLTRLKASGIEDALEMPGPGDGSVISLGLYSEQKRAQARLAQARALGLAPVVADRKRAAKVFWIDIDLKATDASLNPSDLQGEAGRISRLDVKSCPASPP